MLSDTSDILRFGGEPTVMAPSFVSPDVTVPTVAASSLEPPAPPAAPATGYDDFGMAQLLTVAVIFMSLFLVASDILSPMMDSV